MAPPNFCRRIEFLVNEIGVPVEQIWELQSVAVKMACYPKQLRAYLANSSDKKLASLKRNWAIWGRPSQQITEDCEIDLSLAGRGWGKTQKGAHFTNVKTTKDRPTIGAIIGPTASDVRDIMILGKSGIIRSALSDNIPIYESSKRRLTWPNGSYALLYSADEPERLRGPNLDWAWCDELGSWRYPDYAWEMLEYCTRGMGSPQTLITTTPRPIPLLRDLLLKSRDPENKIKVTRGSSFENFWALSLSYFQKLLRKKGSALYRQEVFAEMLDDIEGALWTMTQIDALRVDSVQPDELHRIVIGVDPAEEAGDEGSDNSGLDEIGIVAVGRGYDLRGYVLEDWSLHGTPAKWGRRAYELYKKLQADAIVVETNRGGKMCSHTIRSVVRPGEPTPKIIEVKATKGKYTRAEPIAAIYEEGRFHHCGNFPELEGEMTTFIPGITKKSPNRMDALVWAANDLFRPHHVNN